MTAAPGRSWRHLSAYIHTRASSVPRYVWNGLVLMTCGRIPGVVGIAVRAIAYRAILRARGLPAIERGVELRRPEDVTLGAGVFVDTGVLLDAGPGGLAIGDGTVVMHGCLLQVYNHRGLPHAGIRIGRRAYLGERTLMRGQGGITVGDDVLFGPGVQVLAVDHVFDDPARPIRDQGITARGIVIEDGAWIGGGAVVLDGVTIGRGACVGAGAVVTESVAPRTVVAGVPARVVREMDATRRRTPALKVHSGGLDDL